MSSVSGLFESITAWDYVLCYQQEQIEARDDNVLGQRRALQSVAIKSHRGVGAPAPAARGSQCCDAQLFTLNRTVVVR